MQKLKIAFYTDNYLPITDGVISYIIAMRKELERRGHEVFIITAGDKKTVEFAKNDPNIIVLRGIKFIDNKSTLALDPTILLQAIKGRSFDIIHAHSPFAVGLSAAFISRLTKARLISTFHTHFFHRLAISKYVSYVSKSLSSNRIFLKISKLLMVGYLRLYYKTCDTVISPSKFAKNLLGRYGIKNVEVIEHGLKLKNNVKLKKAEARQLLGLPKKDRIILYLGRISKEKNLEFLIRSAKLLEKKGFKIIIAGSGPMLEEYRTKSLLAGITSISFPGFIKDAEKTYYYRAADIFCNPSTFDTACIADIEAMNNNLPLLVAKRGAQVEFINKGKCGEAFNINDPRDFVNKAMKIVRDRRSYFPRRIADKFNIRKAAENLIALYRKVLSKPRFPF